MNQLIQLKISRKRMFFYIITLLGLTIVYIKLDEVKSIQELFISANGYWLIAAGVTQLLYYYFMALNYHVLLQIKEYDLPINKIFPLTIISQFFSTIVPSGGISGQIYFIYYLGRKGLSIADGISRMILESLILFLAIGVTVIASVGLMFKNGVFRHNIELMIFVYVFIFLALFFIVLFIYIQKKIEGERSQFFTWIADNFNSSAHKMGLWKPKNSETLEEQKGHLDIFVQELKKNVNISYLRKHGKEFWLAFFWQITSLCSQVFVFYFVALAIETQITLETAFITAMLTKFIHMISIVPGSIGVSEFVSTVLLASLGVAIAPALAIALIARAFTFWLPMPLGWVLYQRVESYLNRESKLMAN